MTAGPLAVAELRPGLPVSWRHELRGGYGYTELIPAVVVRCGTRRVLIQVRRKDDTLVERWVRPENLRVREAA